MPRSPLPTLALNDGHAIPQIGLGLWQLPPDRAGAVIGHAVRAGYRLFDTAHAYGNEAAVGGALRDCGLGRDAIFVTSKLWNRFHARDDARRAFDGTMARLGLDYLDLYLIHWPVPMRDLYAEAWRVLVELRDEGRIRSIGVSNFEPAHLERIIGETGAVPAVNQVELHVRFQQRAARAVHDRLGIRTESWSPLGQGHQTGDATLAEIGVRHGKTAPQVALRWHLQQGLIAIPRSQSPAHLDANLALFDFTLSDADMARIAALDAPDGRIGWAPAEFTGDGVELKD